MSERDNGTPSPQHQMVVVSTTDVDQNGDHIERLIPRSELEAATLAARIQELEWILESVRACYFVGRQDCNNEFVLSTWAKVKEADEARAALATATEGSGE